MAKITGKYEVLYIIDATLGEEETAALVNKFKAMVEAEGTLNRMITGATPMRVRSFREN